MHSDRSVANLRAAAAVDRMQCKAYVPSELLLHLKNLNPFT